MTASMWALAGLIMLAFAALGGFTVTNWSKSHTKAARVNVVVAVFFIVAGLIGITDVIHLNAKTTKQQHDLSTRVNCDVKFYNTLRTRSEARLEVDEQTILVFDHLRTILEDAKDGNAIPDEKNAHIQATLDALKRETELRSAPELHLPFPNC